MPLQTVPYKPIGGLNKEDPEIDLGDDEVAESSNFLYERKMAVQRPGVTNVTVNGITETVLNGRSFDFGSAIQTVVVTGTKLYKLSGALVATELTGADTLAFTLPSFAVVNGVVLVGGNTLGLVRWDPAGTVRAVITGAPYRYVVSHLSRAVAAYKLTGNPLLDPRTIAWSSAGDEAVWTGFGSGSTVLADTPDEITGLENVRNVLVIARSSGFHLGYPTGISNPAFNFETHSHDAIGNLYPPTLSSAGEEIYFVGRDDVYSFNLVKVDPIGKAIRRELLALLRGGITYRGFINRSIGSVAHAYYYLAPISNGNYPHFVYDIYEQKWSRHLYNFSAAGGWYMLRTGVGSSVLLADNVSPLKVHMWDDSLDCEQEALLRSRLLVLGDPSRDIKVERVLMRYKTFTDHDVTEVSLGLRASQGTELIEPVQAQVILPSEQRWRRRWFELRVHGQDFELNLVVAAGNRMAVTTFGLTSSDAGDLREG